MMICPHALHVGMSSLTASVSRAAISIAIVVGPFCGVAKYLPDLAALFHPGHRPGFGDRPEIRPELRIGTKAFHVEPAHEVPVADEAQDDTGEPVIGIGSPAPNGSLQGHSIFHLTNLGSQHL